MRRNTGFHFGPTAFQHYVNDMITSVNCDIFLYADDLTLLVGGKIMQSYKIH